MDSFASEKTLNEVFPNLELEGHGGLSEICEGKENGP